MSVPPDAQEPLALEGFHARPTGVRHIVVLVTMLMAVLLYLDRFCVSFAADYIREDLRLSQEQMSWFLGAFFWSYALAQVPSGWLSDRYGARITLVVYIISWSVFTALIGAAQSFLILVVLRLGCGVGQAGAYPTGASIVSKWVPFSRRGTASALVTLGGRLGGAIAPLLTAFLMVLFVSSEIPATLEPADILNGPSLSAKLAGPGEWEGESEEDADDLAAIRVRSLLPPELEAGIAELAARFREPSDGDRADEKQALVNGLNQVIENPDLYRDQDFLRIELTGEAIALLKRKQQGESLSSAEVRRFNRFVLEAVYHDEIRKLYSSGWRPVMFVYGLSGIVVAALFWIYFRDRPEANPRCNDAERALIASGRPPGAPSPHGKPGAAPVGRLMSSPSMWLMCFAQTGTNIGWVFLVTWLPRYLMDVHHVPILRRGLMSSIPLAIGIVGMFSGGRLTDVLVSRIGLRWGRCGPLVVTRFAASIAYVACFAFSFSPWMTESWAPWFFTAAFSVVAFSTDMGSAAIWAFSQDVGGRYVGSVLGWGNMWGNLGAAISPPLYDLVLGESPSLANWNTMFLLCAGAFLASGLLALGVDATKPIVPSDDEHADES